MASILAVGVATLDWIQVVDRYPEIDSEVRAQQQFIWRGGNATNSLAVLSQLGHDCSWFGTLADDCFADIIIADLEKYHIDHSHCPRVLNSVTPTSHILLSKETSSRNITHFRCLRELLASDYKNIDFSQWDWIHFEARNIAETLVLMRHLKQHYPNIQVSLEIEKPREDIEQLLNYADHCLFSCHYANSKGYVSAEKFLKDIQPKLTHSQSVVCAWGSRGAMLLSSNAAYIEVPAFNVDVIDTRAAGDVFNAAFIDARINGSDCLQSVEKACYLAGVKCSQLGIDDLKNVP